jgi:hypothetical protein
MHGISGVHDFGRSEKWMSKARSRFIDLSFAQEMHVLLGKVDAVCAVDRCVRA